MMTPWHKEKLAAKSAEWMWWNQKKNTSDIWWVPSDLTSDNLDKSNPQLSLEDAQIVFEELRKRGLLRIDRIPFYRKRERLEEKHEMVVYFIQRHRERAWLKLANKGTFQIYVGSIFLGLKGFIIACIVFVTATVLGGLLSQIGGDLWNVLKKTFFPKWP